MVIKGDIGVERFWALNVFCNAVLRPSNPTTCNANSESRLTKDQVV